MPDDANLREPIAATIDVVAFMAAAATAVFFGPEVSIPAAAAAGLAPHVGKAVARYMRARVDDLHAGLIAGGVDLDQLADAIESDEKKMDLWRRVLRAGLESPWQEKRRALGRALAEGTLGDSGFDRDARVIKGLDAIEEWDYRVLEFVDRLPERRSPEHQKAPADGNVARAASLEDLRGAFRDDVVDFVIENLENAGLLDNIGYQLWDSPPTWVPTRIADEVLRLVRSAADDERGL